MLLRSLPKVLVVDDEVDVCQFVQEALRACSSGVSIASNARQALDAVEGGDYDVVLSDICMPGIRGVELLALAHQSHWDLAVVLMTGRPDLNDLVSCLRLQVTDFLIKPFSVEQLCECIDRTYAVLQAKREARQHRAALNTALEQRMTDLQRAFTDLHRSYSASLEALVLTLDSREHETCSHSFRVRSYASHLASVSGCPQNFIMQLETAALLHDIGKIAVPDHILQKTGRLTSEEFEIMKRHPEAGARILERIPFLATATRIVRHHHERFDGTGYPDGLAGKQIPLGARIFAIADTLDAITSNRCYRRALSYEHARKEIIRCAGSQFDPEYTDCFCEIPSSTWIELRSEADMQVHHNPEYFSQAGSLGSSAASRMY